MWPLALSIMLAPAARPPLMSSRALTRSLSRAVHTQAHAVAVSGSYAYVAASRGDGLTVVLLDLHSPPPSPPRLPPPPPSPPRLPPSPSPPPYPPGTAAVSTAAGLTSALANTAVGRIVLASGTYYLTAELSITRSVILEAAVAGSVVLHAQASSSSQRRVLNINPGLSGVVQVIGLNITGGYMGGVGGVFVAGVGGGGGVYVPSGTVTITSSSIYGNAASYGGGVWVSSGTVTIRSSSIYGNTGGYDGGGGGVYAGPGGTVSIIISPIYSNSVGWNAVAGWNAVGPNVYVGGSTVCSWSTTLTGVYGSVPTCSAPPPPPSPPPLPPSPPPAPPPITFGPGTFLNSITHQCEIACGPSNGRRMATEVQLDAADGVQTLGDRVRDVSSYLEEHPEVAASIKDEELRSRLKQLFGQPALA